MIKSNIEPLNSITVHKDFCNSLWCSSDISRKILSTFLLCLRILIAFIMIGLATIPKIIPIVISNKVSIIINRSPFVNAPAKRVLYVSIQNNFLTCNCSLYWDLILVGLILFSKLRLHYWPVYGPPSSLSTKNLNSGNGRGPSSFWRFEPSLFTIINEGVCVNPREWANATLFSTMGLFFWLSKHELNFWVSSPGISDANFFKLALFAHPESMGPWLLYNKLWYSQNFPWSLVHWAAKAAGKESKPRLVKCKKQRQLYLFVHKFNWLLALLLLQIYRINDIEGH